MLCTKTATATHTFSLSRFQETCLRVLSFCNSNSLKEGICIHSPIIKLGLQHDLYLTNNLLSLYAKTFGVHRARHLFDEMPNRDVVSWTTILSSHTKTKHHSDALQLFDMMIGSGEYPNEFTLSSALRSCFALGEFERGMQIHCSAVKLGLEMNRFVGTSLVEFYTKCGFCSVEAWKLLSLVKDGGDVVSWTTMLSSLVENGKWGEAFEIYLKMIELGVYPNEFTFVKLLGAVSSFLGLSYGKLLHAHLIMFGAELNLVLKTAVVDMYSKCRRMVDAIKVSNLTPEYDVYLWTTLISGFTQNLQVREAISVFRDMELSGLLPNNFTYSSLLNASSSILSLDLGEQFHSRVIIVGLEDDLYIGNALVDMYMKCSHITTNAVKVFREITSPNVMCWTSLIAGFAEKRLEDSFQLFAEMQAAGVRPNSFTMSAILGACSKTRSLVPTMMLHGHIIKTKVDIDIAVANALVDTYAGVGMIDEAWSVIGTMNLRDSITYTCLAARLNQKGHHGIALKVLIHMCNDGIKMDEFSLASFLSAAAGLGTMETGKQLHCYSVKSGFQRCHSVSNSLVHLYSKCGSIHDANRAFKDISEPDAFSWNGLISGFSWNGLISHALSTFDDMRLAGVKPDSITLLSLISACSHGGLLELGLEYFHSMQKEYHITPKLDHYVCLVDLLGRGGRLEEAMGVIEKMPFKPDSLICKTLLNACNLHGNVALGEDMARRCLELDPSDPAIYLLLANLYDNVGLSDFGEKTRRLMRERGLRRSPGQCWMEIRSRVHHFSAGEKINEDEITEKLEFLITEFRNRRYQYQENEDKFYHPEQLAVAFGVLNAPSTSPIRIYKNSLICSHCHTFIMLSTQVIGREIIMRDRKRFHFFKDGQCSCRGHL